MRFSTFSFYHLRLSNPYLKLEVEDFPGSTDIEVFETILFMTV
jgi:hypothetical protein